MKTIIHLEDKGQDFTEFICDEAGEILEANPFQTFAWAGGYVPLANLKVGELCPIHKPPHIKYGYLNYKVEKIEVVED